MSTRKASVDSEVVYYSEPRQRGDTKPGGPFPARITALTKSPDNDKVELATLDVLFETAVRTKTNVPFAEVPTKHHWSWPPPRE